MIVSFSKLLAYIVTEKIPGISGMPNVRDHDSSIYFKLQGDALSFGNNFEPFVILINFIIHYTFDWT